MSKYRVWLPSNCLTKIQYLSENAFPNECGGLLLGYINQNDIVIRSVSVSGPKSKATETRFIPDQEFDEMTIKNYFFQSNGLETFLGDWHSHPTGDAGLSYLDRLTLSRTARANEFWPVSIMLVLAHASKIWQQNAYLASKRSSHVYSIFPGFRPKSLSIILF